MEFPLTQMLKWLSTLLNKQSNTLKMERPIIVSEDEHNISQSDISHNALKVMNRLNQAGYKGYLVGGGIRDLLLDLAPKDFDVATDATPEEVRNLFRNSRIIGRRFKIVHVRFGREIIEVTTFRGQNRDSRDQIESDTGQLLRDNVYGDLESDALRRDFTANSLYYSAEDGCIYDYTGGLKDISDRRLKMIGDPLTRYKEDPVRMLRAIRFAAKLGFTIDKATATPINEQANLLSNVPPARLFEEILKLFLNGSATATFEQLKHYGLLEELFPNITQYLANDSRLTALIEAVMANTDKRIRAEKRITPAFIYAAFLWPALTEALHQARENPNTLERFHQCADIVISQQLQRIMIPKRFLIPMRQIWELQFRLPNRFGGRAYRLLEHPKFRAAYDFLLLREASGETLDNLGVWWTQFQDASDETKRTMIKTLEEASPRPRRRRRKPKSRQASHD